MIHFLNPNIKSHSGGIGITTWENEILDLVVTVRTPGSGSYFDFVGTWADSVLKPSLIPRPLSDLFPRGVWD